jgi:hypothetical protein
MAQPTRDYSNLGYDVTTRTMSWNQKVRQAEGSRWNLPQAAYFMGENNQYVFVKYDWRVTGPE